MSRGRGPAVLGAVATLLLLVGLLGARTGGAEPPGPVPEPAAGPMTPVLSARRLPSVLVEPGRRAQFAPALDELAVNVPVETTCVLAVVEGGPTLLDRNAATLLRPASNQKLLTAYAVLAEPALGPDFRFRTTFETTARVVNGVLQGDLHVIGSGDPVLVTEDYAATSAELAAVRTPAEGLVDVLRAAGVQRIAGRLLADESRYDNVRYHPNWPESLIAQDVAGPQSAFLVNHGFLTVPDGAPSSPWAARSDEPAAASAARLVQVLADGGIAVDGGGGAAPAPPGRRVVASLTSPAMRDIVGYLLRTSENTVAELLLKELGVVAAGTGSTVAGAAAVLERLRADGFAVDGVVVSDGSGLDDGSLLTCRLLDAVIARSGRRSPLVEGLAVAGVSGTMRRRLAGTDGEGRIHAKTGTMGSITSLAGVVDGHDGSVVRFAIIANDGNANGSKYLEDRLTLAMAIFDPGPPLDRIGPRG